MAQTSKNKGLFLTFEGGEGAGKSTQIRRLTEWLSHHEIPVQLTREPGGTALGRTVREIVLDARNAALSSRAELLLYEADRAQHVDTVIRPALSAGKVVLCDRYADSSTVYQGICRGLGEKITIELNRFATGDLRPDRIFLLDLPETEGIERVRRRADPGGLDRLEKEELSFHRKVRRGFLKIAKANPRRFQIINARLPEETIAQEILAIVERLLKRKGLWKA